MIRAIDIPRPVAAALRLVALLSGLAAASATVAANTPTVSSVGDWVSTPVRGIAPKLGLKPTVPQ